MAGNVAIIAGPAGSGKTDRLLALHRAALRAGQIGTALWIAPAHRSAAEVRSRLLTDACRACFSPQVMTFSQFAEQVLSASSASVEPISDLVERQIIRRLIRAEAARGNLQHFAPIATSAGLIDLVTEFVSELKRHEIWPDDFERACAARGPQRKDRELLAIYRAYQDELNHHQLYDAEGRFWTARALLREGQTRPFEHVRHVVIDGFTDFTRTQHEIIAILAERAAELYISLPLEEDDARADLFAKPIRTLARLRKTHRPLKLEWLPRPPTPTFPALAHVETELFKNPRHVRRAEDAAGIEVIEAARAIDELYLIGRRIKRLLVAGDPADGQPVRPGDVTVVVRSPAAVANLVREAFDELGLPYAIDEGRPLAEVPAIAALVGLVRLHVEDWPFRGLLALLSNNYFQPEWREWRAADLAAATDDAIRSLQIAHGKGTLVAALRRSREDDAREVLSFVERLAAAFDRLPAQATAGEWAKSLVALASETGLTRAMSAGPAEPLARSDRAAWDLLIASLTAVERFATDGSGASEPLDPRALLDLLTDVSRAETLRAENDEVGRVRVLSANSARSLSIPYLYLAGLSERAFPSAERADRLYSEAEYERFADAGLPLVLRAERGQEEMLLFYEVLTRAQRRLYLSYPGLDDKGQPLLPSPYLSELEHVCGGQVERFRVEDLSPIPREAPASAAEQRIAAVARAVGLSKAATDERTTPLSRQRKDAATAKAERATTATKLSTTALLTGLAARPETRGVYENILAGLALTDSRAAREGFGPFEGIFTTDAARTVVARHFGADVRWSASRLEQYAGCPFKFFMSDVLHIEPTNELTVETDQLFRGSAFHNLLAHLHRELNETLRRATSPASPEALAAYTQIVARLLSELRPREGDAAQPFQAAFVEMDRRVMSAWLDDYLAQHGKYDAAWSDFDDVLAPAHFEVSFGEQPASDDPLSTPEPFVLDDGERRVLVRGRIDRIDLGRVAGAPVFAVVDYKTGRVRSSAKQEMLSGDALQVVLYAAAADWLLARDGRRPWAMGYWFVSETWDPAKLFLQAHERADGELRPTEDWQFVRSQLAKHIAMLIDNIRAGRFPVFSRDENCTSFCEFSTVCRINQVRSLEKTWEPSANQT